MTAFNTHKLDAYTVSPINMPTTRTCLRGITGINEHDLFTSFHRFVNNHTRELSPTRV